jgi:hypothetical protein
MKTIKKLDPDVAQFDKKTAKDLGYESVQDLMIAVGQWLYTSDLTFERSDIWSSKKILQEFIKKVHQI